MPTQTLVYALPLPSPFTRKQESTENPSTSHNNNNNSNQYIIQLTIPTSDDNSNGSSDNSTTTSTSTTTRRKPAKSSIMIWAGIGRVKQVAAAGTNKLDAYQKALAEEMQDCAPSSSHTGGGGGSDEVEYETSRKLGDDWACAMPSTLQHTPVASSNLLIGIESDTSEMGAKSGRARSMAERLAKRFHSQIFLSLDIPPAMSLLASIGGPSSDVGSSGSGGALTGMGSRGMGMGGGLPGLDPLGDKLYLGLEKALVGVLEQVGGIA